MPRYILSPQAKEDIKGIRVYILEKWGGCPSKRVYF